MGLKEVPDESDGGSNMSFPASDPTEFRAGQEESLGEERRGLKVVTLAPSTISQPDLEGGNELEAARRDPYLGCTIDSRYKVEARLGEGGMGVVYRCIHKIIGKRVAMKVLRADLARDSEATERFLNEAKAASSIGNPHIIDISDFGQFADGSTYFVMEYLEGQPLSALVGSGKPLPLPRIINIAEQLAEGLYAAHQAQIVHRDLKPDNIYLVHRGQNPDFVKILDFGIAKVSTAEGKLTRAGAVFGTPHYMSPEQAAGSGVDHRGDIYSFGIILYELASGRVPFDADNFMGILTQHIYKSPVPIRALVPSPEGVPPGLEAIILKCLSKRPEQRYQSMDLLLSDLHSLKRGAVPEAVPEMMTRSDSLNVPPDYFKPSAGIPAGSASSNARGRRLRLGAIVGTAAILVSIGLVSVMQSPQGVRDAGSPRAEDVMAPSEIAGKPARPAEVVLAIEPLDARVFRGSEDLGQSPVIVALQAGEQAELSISREGYEPQTIVLDGTEKKLSVKLAIEAPAKPKPSGTPTRSKRNKSKPASAPGKPNIGNPEIINPWG